MSITMSTADSLRAFADFLDSCGSECGPLNQANLEVSFYDFGMKCDEASAIGALAKRLRTFDKEYSDTLFTLSKQFGSLKARFVVYRDAVCQRVVVGTETIPEQVIPATEEKVIPARTVEKVEWRCAPSLLSPDLEAIQPEAA